jgi:hypothetical protein
LERSALPHELRLLVEHGLVAELRKHDEALAGGELAAPVAQIDGLCSACERESGAGRRDGGGESMSGSVRQ